MSDAVSGDVSSDVTSSTSGSTGTGLKKWMPITCASRLVARASFMIGMLDVFDARTASGLHSASRRPNTSIFIGFVLGHGFHDEVAVAERVELVTE